MALLIGTRGGLYRATDAPFEQAELVLDCGMVPRIKSFDGYDGVFSATRSGLYRSPDGVDWTEVPVPQEEVWDVHVHDGDLYAGTFPAHLYRSTDGGETWEELAGLRDQPSAPKWRNPFADEARVRTIASHPDAPDRLVLALEAGGFYRSEDRGENWARWDVGGQDDFHHLIPLGPAEYISVCGRLSITDLNHGANMGGIFHTDDAGDSWTKLDGDVQHSYFRQALHHDGRLYAGGSLTIPPVWLAGLSPDAALYVSDDMKTFDQQEYPGGPDELILSWAVHEGSVVGGTAGGDVFGPGDPAGGRLIREVADGEWEDLGPLPHDVHAVYSY
ncbi:MAG: WD40/YVTN/BNR-like repeat-containing protein [Halorientalis sp.]